MSGWPRSPVRTGILVGTLIFVIVHIASLYGRLDDIEERLVTIEALAVDLVTLGKIEELPQEAT